MRTEALDPHLTNDLTDIDDPAVKSPITDNFEMLPISTVPRTDMELPILQNCRRDRHEPIWQKLAIETELASLQKDLRERLEVRFTMLVMDKLPWSWLCLAGAWIEKEEPHRAKCRNDMELPRWKKSRTDKCAPIRVYDLTLTLDPRFIQAITERFCTEPIFKRP